MPPDLKELTPESIKKDFDEWKARQVAAAAPPSNLIVTPFLTDEPAPDAPAASQDPLAAADPADPAEPADHESTAQEAGTTPLEAGTTITESSP